MGVGASDGWCACVVCVVRRRRQRPRTCREPRRGHTTTDLIWLACSTSLQVVTPGQWRQPSARGAFPSR